MTKTTHLYGVTGYARNLLCAAARSVRRAAKLRRGARVGRRPSPPAVVFAAASAVESLEDRALFSTFVVTNINDSGAGSLRDAINQANKHLGADDIHFAIGSGLKTITPASPLPAISDPVDLDATTQPGYAGKPVIQLSGARAGSGAYGLTIVGGNSTVRGFAINRFGRSGVMLGDRGGNVVAGNYIGTDPTGTLDQGNNEHGVLVTSRDNRVGGTSAADRNVISGNAKSGVSLNGGYAGDNVVQGNYIGTNAAGSKALANGGSGVASYQAWGALIGGTSAGARNVISGNLADGVVINGAGGNGNKVQGNYIGTDATGAFAIGNAIYGVEVSTANNTVGGTTAGARNVISGNKNSGLALWLTAATGNTVQGNYIGTDATGTRDVGNAWRGIDISNGPSNNLVADNVVSSNHQGGVGVYSASKNNRVQGNYIGTNAAGTAALGNWGSGVVVAANAGTNTIGGPSAGAGNVISGNTDGLSLMQSTGQLVQGNRIGTNAAGTGRVANGQFGVAIGSSNNTLDANVIAGNGADGVHTFSGGANAYTANRIGLTAGGAAMGNGGHGIDLNGGSNSRVSGNTIANNAKNGVQIGGGNAVNNRVTQNSIYSNGMMGVNLSWFGTNANDTKDGDSGANGVQNFPVLSTAVGTSAATSVAGTLNSRPGLSYRVEFFASPSADAGGYGEGKQYLGAATVTTDGSGNGRFALNVAAAPAGWYVTANATDPSGNTSEFSKALKMTGGGGAVTTNPTPTPTPAPTPTPNPAPSGNTYQAESAKRSGVSVSTSNAGYTGSGFADYANASGDYVEFTVNAPSAGTYALDFRYANGGGGGDRPLQLKVNGAVARDRLSFPSTGSWTTWKTVTATFSLKAGTNTVRLTDVGSSGPNLDALTLRATTSSVVTPAPESPSDSTDAPAALRIAAAGSQYTDSAGHAWSAPTGFSGGTAKTGSFAIAGTTDDALYSARRYGGSFTFSKAVANGTYTLRLHMAETSFGAAGKRVFSVKAEGQTILNNYDIYADVGANRAVAKSFTVNVTDGKLDLAFTSSVNYAIVSAIELIPA